MAATNWKRAGKSVRCADCRLNDRCEGIHINMIRDQGLRQAQPLIDGDWADEAVKQLKARWPEPHHRVHHGRDAVGASPSLPGFAAPDVAPRDPLAVIGEAVAEKAARRKARREAIRKEMETQE